MANLKIRGERESVEAKGPQNGLKQDMNIGASTIENCPAQGQQVSHPTSGPRTQPKSSLGAKQIKRYTSPCKA
jgi:hypothetical protein